MVSCRERGNNKPVLCLACYGLSIGLLAGLAGCGKNPRSTDHVEVSGNVLFQGNPLPGGEVKFVAINGGFAATGIIDENGHYQVKAPVGEVEIGVTNRMLQPNRRRQGGVAPGDAETPRQKKGVDQQPQLVKGHWVNIPSSYADPHTSGLKYTVKAGTQTHDIELTAKDAPSPGAPGS